jgi:hypothetical protein
MAGFISRLKAAFFGTPTVAHPTFPTRIGPGGRPETVPLDRWTAGRQGTGTKIASMYGHPDALLAPTEIQRLFSGEWVPVSSSWIAAIQYDHTNESTGMLYVRLLRGNTYGPTVVSPAEMAALASAPSKGHTVNQLWRRARVKP